MRVALVVFIERVAFQSHEAFIAFALSRSQHLIRTRPLSRTHLALLVHGTLVLALAAPESALAVRAARRPIEVRIAFALARSEMAVQTAAMAVAARAGLAARAEVAVRAGVAHIGRAPSLVAETLPAPVESVVACSVVAGLALLAARAVEARQAGLAGGGGVEAVAADLADALGTIDGDLDGGGVGLGLRIEVEDGDVVEAVGAVLGMVVRQLDLRAVVRLRGVRPVVIVHPRVRRGGHEQHHVRLVLAEPRHRHLHRRVGGLVEVEEGLDSAREGHQTALARLIGLQHEGSYASVRSAGRTESQLRGDGPGGLVGGSDREGEGAVDAEALLVLGDHEVDGLLVLLVGRVRVRRRVLRVVHRHHAALSTVVASDQLRSLRETC